jgi:ubiquitin C-terminal hydrolase
LLPEWALHASAAAPTFIVRRGALNSGNTCYLNASVQALLSCDAFVALLRYVSEVRDAARASMVHALALCLTTALLSHRQS